MRHDRGSERARGEGALQDCFYLERKVPLTLFANRIMYVGDTAGASAMQATAFFFV
jgi:hypothetical protein